MSSQVPPYNAALCLFQGLAGKLSLAGEVGTFSVMYAYMFATDKNSDDIKILY